MNLATHPTNFGSYPQQLRHPVGQPNSMLPNPVQPSVATRQQYRWLIFLVLSFFYELPIAQVTSMHRVNPRLFDVATAVGVLFILPKLTHPPFRLALFKTWTIIVSWFAICAVIWAAAWLPFDEAGKFSVFYAMKYLQGLLVVYMVTRIRLSTEQKRKLMYWILAGGFLVTAYAIPEYRKGATVRNLGGGKFVARAPGTVFSCLGPTYGHVGSISSLAVAFCIALLMLKNVRHTFWLGFSAFLAWPALVCGSRSGLFSVALVYAFGFLWIQRLRGYGFAMVAVVILVFATGIVELPSVDKLKESSRSLTRTIDTEENARHNTILGRIFFSSSYDLRLYKWQGYRMPIFGGGFYAVPHTINGQLKFRVGYGVHNGFAFPLEQAGIAAFIMFLIFLYRSYKEIRVQQLHGNSVDRAFATATMILFVICLLRSLVGNIFWLGNGMEHFSVLVILLLVLAATPSVSSQRVVSSYP